MKLFIRIVSIIILVAFSAFILALSVRGLSGNPTKQDLQTNAWKEDGPFELSPERGRFALLYSFIEDRSFTFDLPIARFATPDVAVRNDGKYVSLFAPAVSFIVAPGYLIGKYFGVSQVGTYAMISVVAIINMLLVRAIALRLKASKTSATIGAFVFLFATPAFPYAVTLYQHHISVFLILLSIYSLLRFKTAIALVIVWLLLALSISVDYPNAIFMAPIALFALSKIAFFSKKDGKSHFTIKPFYIFTFLAIVPSVLFYMWFSLASYNSPFQFSGTLKSAQVIDEYGKPAKPIVYSQKKEPDAKSEPSKNKSAVGFFKTRYILEGFNIQIFSNERGILWYTPVMLFGILGVVVLYRANGSVTALFLGIIGANVLLYSMWGDPWGGWAFGSRYLIPSYALMSIFLALGLSSQRGKKRIVLAVVCFVLAFYSMMINTLGALTTSRIPPKVEADALSKISNRIEKYSYDRSIDFLLVNKSKSFVWQTYAYPYVDSVTYYWIVVGLLGVASLSLFSIYLFFDRKRI